VDSEGDLSVGDVSEGDVSATCPWSHLEHLGHGRRRWSGDMLVDRRTCKDQIVHSTPDSKFSWLTTHMHVQTTHCLFQFTLIRQEPMVILTSFLVASNAFILATYSFPTQKRHVCWLIKYEIRAAANIISSWVNLFTQHIVPQSTYLQRMHQKLFKKRFLLMGRHA